MGSLWRAAGAALVTLGLAVTCEPGPGVGPATPEVTAGRPNIVFVLTDDLTVDLLRFMPQVRRLAAEGVSFSNYVVTNSLCCPSRASILTGRFPHNTGVLANAGPAGGFPVFRRRGNEEDTFATGLRAAGYRTALFGKYLNGYDPASGHVPPGWDEWAVAGNAYAQVGYALNENGRIRGYGGQYLTGVLGAKAESFIRTSAQRKQPFLVEISTFAPHSPFAPAPQDANAFPGLTAPRGPAFDRLPVNPPPWLAGRPPLNDAQRGRIDDAYRKRAQSVLSIDRMIGGLRATLAETGVADDTVLVFSSDNGFHLGEYRLTVGKQTAFETDVRVPLIMSGPGVEKGRRVAETAENIDLRPTFDALAGADTPPDVDGRSLLSLISTAREDRDALPPPSAATPGSRGPLSLTSSGIPVYSGMPKGSGIPEDSGIVGAGWRTAALIEHHHPESGSPESGSPESRPDDPDRQKVIPESYVALRTPEWTFVRYASGAREFYDRRTDPHQLRNTAAALSPARRAALDAALTALATCRGAVACDKAAMVRA
ncbi:arylsulfatase A-like enzyme [Catenuloplanes nepalensis]|uniref:Arylsulfatase A-like enzyme n=1 Tax=Catenuloplanes nepalensis TaxID=587533 RepID=A0ABT9MN39_9ACTN|nr:sulfatase [Catenuloplanes nepalensis]MDP9792822.1 arylsulfatase A-like enzyme [Catenuloplanes nepalensis]